MGNIQTVSGENCPCCASEDPCIDCDPNGEGTAPNSGMLSGCDPIFILDYSSYIDQGDYCQWSYESDNYEVDGSIWFALLDIFYSPDGATIVSTDCSNITLSAGEWGYRIEVPDADGTEGVSVWQGTTTGIACDSGQISGVINTESPCFTLGDPLCTGNLTITIDP